jgi:hypothetical protein
MADHRCGQGQGRNGVTGNVDSGGPSLSLAKPPEACRELRAMVEAINADRAVRGVAPLDIEITIPGEQP